MIDSPPLSLLFFSLFLSLSQFRKGRVKTRRGSFPSILIIVGDAAPPRLKLMKIGTVSRYANCRHPAPFLALPGTSKLPKCAGKQRLAIEERIVVRRGYFRPCGICLPFHPASRPSFKHSFSFVALLEGYLTAIQL